MKKRFQTFSRPDGLDQMILNYIMENPSTNVRAIWKHVKQDDGLIYNELTIRHRVKTLEKALYIKTKRVGNERHCWIKGAGHTYALQTRSNI